MQVVRRRNRSEKGVGHLISSMHRFGLRGEAWRPIAAGMVAVGCLIGVDLSVAQQPAADVAQRCEWIDGTLIPQVVIGVRRLGDAVEGEESVDFLNVLSTASGGEIAGRARLFRPYYVTSGGIEPKRVRIQEGYHSPPLGWVERERLVFLESRYAYVFAQPGGAGRPELHDLSREAYERHLAQLKNQDDAKTGQTVVLRQRADGEAWLPRTRDDAMPFIELLQQAETAARDEADYPDTTPTFRYGFPLENRLLHMGAVCGGPVDVEALKALKANVATQAGLEMLFVIDETSSMRPYFEGVADFLEDVGSVAVGSPDETPGGVRFGVACYSDGPDKDRWFRWSQNLKPTPTGLAVLGRDDAAALAQEIRTNDDKLPPGDFADAPERSLEAFLYALQEGSFTPGASKYAVLIGDTGYQPDPKGVAMLNPVSGEKLNEQGKGQCVRELTQQIEKQDLTVFFVHVGDRKTDAQVLFKQDAELIKAGLSDEMKERVSYITAETSTLTEKLKEARDRAEALRRKRERDIVRMESRNQATEPGPKLLDRLLPQRMTREQYESSLLQYYVPTRGWLYEPAGSTEQQERLPQFTEFVFLSPAERQPLVDLLNYCRERLAKNLPVDGSEAVKRFAETLARTTDEPAVRGEVMACWESIPERQQRVGVFLEDTFGLRVKATLPFPPDGYREETASEKAGAPEDPHVTHEFWRALLRVEHLLKALKAAEDDTFWFESASLVP